MELQFDTLKNKFLDLPPVLQDAISSVHVADTIYEIGQRNDLRIDEMGVVAKEAGLVMIGASHPEGFLERVKKELPGVSPEKVEKVVTEINNEVFKEIRSALVELHKKQENQPTSVQPATPITPPVPQQPQPNTIAKTKLEQSFHIPTQTATVSLGVPAMTPQASAQPIKRREVDPYREPIQ